MPTVHTGTVYPETYGPWYSGPVDAAAALAFDGARREVRFRFDLLDTANHPIGDVTGDVAAGARISYNALADVSATLQATIRDTGGVDWLQDRLRPWMDVRLQDGTWQPYPLGVYLPATTVRQGRGRGAVMRPVDGYDLLQLLADDKAADRVTYLAGAQVVGVVRDELEAAGLADHNLTPSTETLSADREWPPGTSRLRRINDLLAMIGYEAMHISPRGAPVARPWRPPDQRSAVWVYRDDADSVALPTVDHELDLWGIANRWVLVASEPDQEPLVAVRENTDAASPTSQQARGRVITDFREGAEATSQAALDAQADRIASEASQVYEAVDFTSALMPVHWHASVVDLVWSELGLAARYVEHKWDMTLAAGGEMSHRVRRVVTVA